jgi:hypothetical protein
MMFVGAQRAAPLPTRFAHSVHAAIHMPDTLLPIIKAIESGNKKLAKRLLRPLLDHQPTADVWYIASQLYDKREHQITCLRRALALDPTHRGARRGITKLRQESNADFVDLADPRFDFTLPPLSALVGDADPTPAPPPNYEQISKKIWNKKRTSWAYIGLGASILLTLSLSYFVLTVLGSPLPAHLRSIFSGSPPAETDGTPVFGRPVGTINQPQSSSAESNPSAQSIETPSPRIFVQASQSKPLELQKPLSDVLDPGFTHEYTFRGNSGEELAIGVQFFSPTAQKVGPNVAVLDPDDLNAEGHCQRDSILKDNSGVAFICQIHVTGNWKLQLFGRAGESTGVYVVTVERF